MDGGYNHHIPSGDVVRKIPAIDGEGSTASVGSHSSGDETLQQPPPQGSQDQHQGQEIDHTSNSASYFTFSPDMHDGLHPPPHPEIKHEMHNPSDIHKPKPLTPSGPHLYPVAMPFVQVAGAMHGQGPPYSSYSMAPYNSSAAQEHASFMNVHAGGIDGGNRNNNNSSNTAFATYATGLGNHMMAAMNPVFIPPSPGFFMAPTGKMLSLCFYLFDHTLF